MSAPCHHRTWKEFEDISWSAALEHRDRSPGFGSKTVEFRAPPGHLHHDSMVASVIILSAFRNFGRTHHVFTSIRRFSIPREHGDQTIATVVSQGLYRRRRALALPDARPECGAVWRDRLARGRLSGGRRLPHHGRDRLRRRSPPDTTPWSEHAPRRTSGGSSTTRTAVTSKSQCAARGTRCPARR